MFTVMKPARPAPPAEVLKEPYMKRFLNQCHAVVIETGPVRLSMLGDMVSRPTTYKLKDLLKYDPEQRFRFSGSHGTAVVELAPEKRHSKLRSVSVMPRLKQHSKPHSKPHSKLRSPVVAPPPKPEKGDFQRWQHDNPIHDAFVRMKRGERPPTLKTPKTECWHWYHKNNHHCSLFASYGSARCTYFHGKDQKFDGAKLVKLVAMENLRIETMVL